MFLRNALSFLHGFQLQMQQLLLLLHELRLRLQQLLLVAVQLCYIYKDN